MDLSLLVTESHTGVSQENMEFIHQVLAHEIRPSNHVEWVSKNWHEHVITDKMESLEDFFADFHEDDFSFNVLHGEVTAFILVSCSQD